MYTIIMNSDKSLTASVRATIYQRESLADKIQFLLPQKYEELKLRDMIVALKYVDQANVPHLEELVPDEELYKDRLRYVMPVDTRLTKFAGDIKIHLSFLSINTDSGLKDEVMHTGELTIAVLPLDDYFGYVPSEYLEVVDRALLEVDSKIKALNAVAQTYDEEKADNIVMDDDSIHLTSNGNIIGDKIPLYELGDTISESTDSGLVKVITEDEVETLPDQDSGETVKYTLQLNQESDELYLLANGKIVSRISTKEIGESIIDCTPEGVAEVIT